MSTESLFDDFPVPSSAGSQLPENLDWKTPAGFDIAPVYYKKDLKKIKPSSAQRATETNPWLIRQNIEIDGTKSANQRALKALMEGATAIAFIGDEPDAENLLKGIQTEHAPVSFIGTDGQCPEGVPEKFRFHEMDAANMAQALAAGNELLAAGVDASRIRFNAPVGISYFLEIAKLRVLRMLWATVCEQYTVNEPALINAIPLPHAGEVGGGLSPFIALTTQVLAAAIGGADSITVADGDDFNARISRNIQLLAMEESYLARVADPSAGSYYIETLTDKLAESVWEEFKKNV